VQEIGVRGVNKYDVPVKPGATRETSGDQTTEGDHLTVIWAGKKLSVEEEARVRDIVAMFTRMAAAGDPEAGWQADSWTRFLPEQAQEWMPDELELGAHLGYGMTFGLQPQPAPE
jgi:hypothetical protein